MAYDRSRANNNYGYENVNYNEMKEKLTDLLDEYRENNNDLSRPLLPNERPYRSATLPDGPGPGPLVPNRFIFAC